MKKLTVAVLALLCVVSGIVRAQDGKFPDTPKEFDMKYFLPRHPRPPIKTNPFTAQELLKVAPGKIKFSRVGGAQVTIRKSTQVRGVKTFVTVQVPLDKYLAELNAYEEFLNKFGSTLRDGKLSKTTPNNQIVRSDMGVLFELRSRKSMEIPPPKMNVESYDPRKLSRFIPYDPTGILNLRDRIAINPGERVGKTGVSGVNTGNLRFNPNDYYTRRVDGSHLHVVNGKVAEIIIGAEKSFGGHVLRVSEGSVPDPDCPPKEKTYDGIPILGAESSCTSAAQDKAEATFKPCSPFAPAEGDPLCLYDGALDAKGIEVARIDFDSEGGGNGWFGSYAWIQELADVQQEAKHVTLVNTGIAHAGVEILGSKLGLVEATNNTRFDNQSGQSSPQPEVIATALPGTLNVDLKTSFDQFVEGPGTRFFIGPVPISITSNFQASLKLDTNAPPFQNFPDNCASSQTGAMSMKLGLDAAARLRLRAAIDAIVASAGIEGELVLVNDNFDGVLTTEVAPSVNKITFKPKFTYSLEHLSGHIYLFVELDMLVYTKEWKVEIISFDGFKSKDELAPKEFLVISSKKKK